jgi:hypothetical protein
MRLPWPRREHPSRCCGATYAANPPIAKRNQMVLSGAVSCEHRSSLRLKGVPRLDSGSDSDVREGRSTTGSFSPMQLQVRSQPAQSAVILRTNGPPRVEDRPHGGNPPECVVAYFETGRAVLGKLLDPDRQRATDPTEAPHRHRIGPPYGVSEGLRSVDGDSAAGPTAEKLRENGWYAGSSVL